MRKKKKEQRVRFLSSWVSPISKGMNVIASVFLFCMMLLTITDVFLRKTFSKSILGTVEVTEFMMVIVVFFGLAHAEVLGRHVKVDLVMSRLNERTQGIVDIITQFTCFVLFGIITAATLVYSIKMGASKEVSQDLWIPIYPFIYVVAVGCAVLSLALLVNVFVAYKKMRKG